MYVYMYVLRNVSLRNTRRRDGYRYTINKYKPNKGIKSPQISDEEENLPIKTRSILAQLGKCRLIAGRAC